MTELDVRANREMGGQLEFSHNGEAAITEEIKKKQEDKYNEVFSIMRKHADKVDCVTFWNLSDRDSWLGADNYPLLFDRDYKPKKAYYVVRDFK